MQAARKPRPLLALATLAALGLAAAHPQAAQAQTFTFTYTDGDYASPNFTNSNGTYNFTQTGNTNTALTLTPGVARTFSLDNSVGANWDGSATNAAAPAVYTGTASSGLTFTYNGASLGTQTVSYGYSLNATTPGAQPATFTGGGPLTFAVGGGQQLIITPIASSPFRRATALLAPAASTVPEPSSVAAFAFTALGAAALILRARKRPTA